MFWAGMGAAALSSLANIGGGLFSAAGASSANAANMAQTNMMNQQMLNAEMAKHEQNTAFMEDSQAHDFMKMHQQNLFNSAEAEKARLFSSNEAGRQMAFQYDLATTAYQRAMKDAKQAGLNPILAYQQGGAPMGAGAMGSGPAASAGGGSSAGMASGSGAPGLRSANILNDKSDLGRAIGNAVSSAVDTMKTLEGVDLMKQQNKESQQREVVGAAEARLKHWDAEKRERETEGAAIQNDILRANAQTAKEMTRVVSGEAGNMERYGRKEAPDTLERLLRTIQGWFETSKTVVPPPASWDNSPKLF